MAGSLFTEARSVTLVVFMRENAQTSAFSIRMVIRQNRRYDRDSIFTFDSVWIAYSIGLMFSESSLQVVISVPYYCPVIHAHCIADARFVSARDVIHDTIEEFNVD